MQTFTPDSSIVSDVIPSPNYGERNKGRLARHDPAALHRHARSVEGAIARLCTRGHRRLRALHRAGGRPHRADACRRPSAPGTPASSLLGRRGGHQFLLDRHRDHQSRPRLGLSGFSSRQIAAVIALCRGIMLRRNIAAHRVLGHSDVAPARKKDPGEKFPWHSLANSGVGHWVMPAPIVRGEALKLGTIRRRRAEPAAGVRPIRLRHRRPTASTTPPTMEVVTAFQRHFRPARVDGVADHSTLTTLQALLASLPADATAVAAK